MLSKEQFERFEKDVKNMMEDFGIRAKLLNSFNGTNSYNEEIDTCRLYIDITSALKDGLIEYAKSNFNDIQTVMSRTIETNDFDRHFSDEQGFVDEFGCINFYDGIFHYEFKNNKLENVYLDFMSVGIGNYYSRRFWLDVHDSDELKFSMDIIQRSNMVNLNKESSRSRRRFR